MSFPPDSSIESANLQTHDIADIVMQLPACEDRNQSDRESCLVQIYPADVVDGMMLLGEDIVSIGRDRSSGLVLPDNSVSRRHAEVIRESTGYSIRDLGSTNGTFLNGRPVEHHRLSPGDTIRVGTFLFKFLSAGSVETQYHETVYNALTRDALTGTMNKRFLLDSMQRAIAAAARQKHTVSVVMLDIDHFKRVNDSYGHLVGDELLRGFGHRIANLCREDDLFARYGGEEFCLLLSATERHEAVAMAERCRRAVADEPFPTAVGPLSVTASFGVSSTEPDVRTDATQLIESADQKLYEAKRTGRDRICG